jgi:hypothetical protein
MTHELKKNFLFKVLRSTNRENVEHYRPLILKMYDVLNEMNLNIENRYILCNFLDQYSDLLEIDEDIYVKNNEKTLNQLFLLAFNKAKKFNLLHALYDDYFDSIKAISEKKEFKGLIKFNQ